MQRYQSPGVGPTDPSPAIVHSAPRPRVRPGLALLLVCCLFLVLSGPAAAGDGALDPAFDNLGAGVQKIPLIRGQADWTSTINSVTAADGNSLIFGYFTSVTDSVTTYARSSIAKLTDFSGTVDPSFNIPVNGEVRGVYLANPGSAISDIIIWGSFSLSMGGPTYYNLARLKWNDTISAYVLDTTFNGGTSIFNPGGLISTVAVTGNYLSSYTLVGGYNLQPVGGAANTAYHLIRLNSNFSYDGTYTRALSLPGGFVNAISFTNSNQPRLFGTLPQSGGGYHWMETIGTDLVTLVNFLSDIQIDGPIFNMGRPFGNPGPFVIIGAFKNVFGTPLNRVALINNNLNGLDGTNNFNTNIMSSGPSTGGADHTVPQAFIMGTGQVILAGSLTNFNGTACGHLVRLNTDGTVDSGFLGGARADDRIFRLYQPAGGAGLQIVGSFQHYNGTPRHGIASLDINGNLQTSAYTAVNPTSNTPGTVYALGTQWGNNGPQLIIGGDFTGVGGKFHQNLALLNRDGSVDNSFVSVVEGQVNAVRTMNGGQILLAGNFGQAQGFGCTSLARLNQDGSFDPSFKPVVTKGDGTVAGLRMVDKEDSGNFDIGGNFAFVADSSHIMQPRTAFAVLDPSGYCTSFNAQFALPGDKIKVNIGGNIGGNYAMVGYLRQNGLDHGFGCVLSPTGSQISYLTFNGEVLCGTTIPNGRIVIGGNFTQVTYPNQASRGYIAALAPNFTLDSSFAGAGADGPVWDMRTQGDHDSGKPLIAGAFAHYNGTARAGVARLNLDGSVDNSSKPGTGNDGTGPVYSVNWFNNRAVFGGAFTSYNGTPMPGVAQVLAGMGTNLAPINLLLLLQN